MAAPEPKRARASRDGIIWAARQSTTPIALDDDDVIRRRGDAVKRVYRLSRTKLNGILNALTPELMESARCKS